MKKKDWLQRADDYANEREHYLLTAIEEVQRIDYAHPNLARLDDSHKTVLCYLAGAVGEMRRIQVHMAWLMQKRAEEEADEKKD